MNLKESHPSQKNFTQYGKVQIGSLELESGETLRDVEVAYERTGVRKAPVVLVCHALTGNQASVGTGDNPGWWYGLIGKEAYIDTNKFDVITMNVIGGCSGSTGPTSVNRETGKPYRSEFPAVAVRDMVRAQHAALNKLGVEKVLAVVGGSLGGMQAFEWGVMYPDFMENLIIMAATPSLSDYGIAFNAIGRQAIMSDPEWKNGEYEDGSILTGLKVARMAGMVTYRSSHLYNSRFRRAVRQDRPQYLIESYLTYQGEKLAKRFDANSYLTLLGAMDSHDIGYGRGGLRAALKKIKANVTALGYKDDLLYPPSDMKCVVEELVRLGKTAQFYEVETEFGHDGFLVEYEKWGQFVELALTNQERKGVGAWQSK